MNQDYDKKQIVPTLKTHTVSVAPYSDMGVYLIVIHSLIQAKYKLQQMCRENEYLEREIEIEAQTHLKGRVVLLFGEEYQYLYL